jgi:hypothetical protein
VKKYEKSVKKGGLNLGFGILGKLGFWMQDT